MATIHHLRHTWLGERGVVVIDSDQAMVRLVRTPAAGAKEKPGELCEGAAQEILRGFLRLTSRG